MSKKVRVFDLIFIGVLLILAVPFLVYSQTASNSDNSPEIDELNTQIEAKKKKIAELEKAIEQYKSKIQETHLTAVSLSNQMALLDNHIAQVELDVQATQEKISSVQLQIQGLRLSIGDKSKTIDRQKIMLAELLRSLQHENDKKYIEILTAYNSFSDFFNRLQYLEKIQQNLGTSARNLRLAKEDLEGKKTQAEERQRAYDDLQKELKGKKSDLEGEVKNKENLLADTQSSELKYKTLVSSLRSQYQQIENEIGSIEKQVRRKVEEAQRKKPEEFDTDATELSWPLASRRITAYFHDPGYPFRTIFEHNAIDIATPQGSVVRAAASGYVARAKRCASATCYSYVMLVHSSGISTVYGHLNVLGVAEEQFVTRGDIIGYSGATPGTIGAGPFTTGPHLHMEVRKNGIPVDPLDYLK